MLTVSHIAIAKNTLKFLELQGINVLDKKSFIYGNIKPDTLFQKTPKTHLELESLPFVLKQIDDLINWSGVNNKLMSLELGVISHFLCDYFCLPHFERWSKCSILEKIIQTPRHLNYERMLVPYIVNATMEYREIKNINDFLNECKKEYILKKSFENDVRFASLVCNSVMLYILKKQ